MTQEEKSASTRERLLDATVACLVEHGYANTTTNAIAERAGLSRGAMLHHYPARAELVAAAVEHLGVRRIAEFVASVSELPDDMTLSDHIVDLLWGHFESTTFDAILELSMAARTDAELAAIIHPLERRFDTIIADSARSLFARLSRSPESFESERRFVYFLLHGLAMKRRGGADPREIRAALDDLKASMRRAREKIAQDSGAATKGTKSGGKQS